MKKTKMKAFLCVLLLILTVPLTACGNKIPPPAVIEGVYEWQDPSVTDSSKVSSWNQERKMDLVAWDTRSTGGHSRVNSSNDIVSAEIKRITGVGINAEKSFDNKGSTAAARYTVLQSTGLPDISYGKDWLDKDAVYDLSALIDEYCPTIKARVPSAVWNLPGVNGGDYGKVYGIPYALGNMSLSEIDPEADPAKSIMFDYKDDYYPYVLVREDTLREAYGPSVKTTAEIQAIYDARGGFTEEELFDVEITSAAQFRTEFLPKISQAIKNNPAKYRIASDRSVIPIAVSEGTDRDTYGFLDLLLTRLLGAKSQYAHAYWDISEQAVKAMSLQDFFKDELAEWVKMINNGVYCNDLSLYNTYANLQAEMSKGYYAIAYGNLTPSGNQAVINYGSDAGKTVKYRRVYMKIEPGERFTFFGNATAVPSVISIFKDSVREGDLPQILRWLDFQASELGDKLFAWGPESAGLFEYKTVNGESVRRYKDEALATQMVYSTASMGPLVQKYNLSNGTLESAQTIFPFIYAAASKDHPKCSYDLSSLSDLMSAFFSSAVVCKDRKVTPLAKSGMITLYTNNDIPGHEALVARRPGIEAAMKSVLVSGNNFETKYRDFVNKMTESGWTDEYFGGPFQEAFLNANIDYLDPSWYRL